MALQTVQFPATPGEFVPAEVATQLEQTLHKLVWNVLYGKAIDAAGIATGAEQLLGRLRSGATPA